MKTNGTYDVIVIGVGGMGSATVYELASRGMRVLGLERFSIPNDSGSSHGVNRIIRMAYYEEPSYVPLLRRSYERWHELEEISGEKLLYTTGSVDTSHEDGRIFTGSLRSCREHDLAHEVLTSAELTQRFPGFRFPESWMGVYQPDGGFRALGEMYSQLRLRRTGARRRSESSRGGAGMEQRWGLGAS